MKIIEAIILNKYQDENQYQKLSEYIYQKLDNKSVRIALKTQLENEENTQYPLEDLLDKYYLNVTDYFKTYEIDKVNYLEFELEGSLEEESEDLKNIQAVEKLLNKRIYNIEKDGYIILEIE